MTEQKKIVPKRRFKEFQNDQSWEQRQFFDNIKNTIDFRGRTPRKLGLDWSETGYLALSALNVKNGYIDPSADAHYGNQELYDKWMTGSALRYGQVLFTTEAPMGNVAQVPDNNGYILSQRTIAFDVNTEKITDDFLAVLLRSPKTFEELSALSSGGTAKGVSQKSMSQLKVIVPSNLEEQTKIGAFFKNLDHLITLHQRKLEKAEALKSAYLSEMFPAEGECEPRRRFAGFTDAWEQCTVGELTNVASAARVHKEEWASSGIPFFRSSDVVSAYKGKENEKAFISIELYEQLARVSGKLEKDDILITGGGSIGIPYIVPNNDPLYSKDADLIWIKSTEKFNSRYLYTYFTSPEFRRYLRGISHIGTIAHYTIEQVKETPIRLPSIDEQNEIGSYFTQLDHLITLHQRKLEKLQSIKKAYLNEMFV
ncbi:restriction endonuclease subunit S [Paenibacillus sp. OV219]|uniref:restriction endonuclease subunit S n=1 Tax=Paenibacillus sp. OV219 TaxID=1884377 RepID=UPI0008B30AD9|nr:restriction endonuclease subunit S [Paenibacillus sp. OV219]SEP01253.1 type I restriction enzyme, S subunit [Paenibacillus sp. OV219]